MLTNTEFEKIKKMFPVKTWTVGVTIEELAANAGEQRVLEKLRQMIASQGFVRGQK